MKEFLKEWGAMASALTCIIGLFLTVVRPLRLFIKKHLADDEAQAEQLKQLKEHQLENYKGVLRLQMYSADLDLSERVNAGDKYILIGNGAAKVKHEENVAQLRRESSEAKTRGAGK